MERIVITKEIVEYHGKCPECGKEQKNSYESGVDILCYECTVEQGRKEAKKLYEYLIKSTITDITGYKSLRGYLYMNTIKVKTLENKEYTISGHMNVEGTVDEE